MQNTPIEAPTTEPEKTRKTRTRHGCLTAWLIFVIICAAIVTIIYITNAGDFMRYGHFPGWIKPAMIVLSVFDIICAIALLNWKKWGFWGFCCISLVGLIINLAIGTGVVSFFGLFGIAILFWVLNMGGEDKAWTQLE